MTPTPLIDRMRRRSSAQTVQTQTVAKPIKDRGEPQEHTVAWIREQLKRIAGEPQAFAPN